MIYVFYKRPEVIKLPVVGFSGLLIQLNQTASITIASYTTYYFIIIYCILIY